MAGKSGKPKALEAEEAIADEVTEHQSPEQFAAEFFGSSAEPQNGMPTLEWLKEHYKTKSAAVRFLSSELVPGGPFAVKLIARHMGMRYQHVRNVATTSLKRGPNEDWRPKVPTQTLTDLDSTDDFDKE